MQKTVLVVDDDPSIRDIFSMIFKQAGYGIQLIANGEDLLNNKFEIPNIFLIDKQLSGTSGIDICRHLKSNPRTKNIPVVMISASPDINVQSKNAGADAYLEKPFEIGYLLKLINRYIR